MMKKDNITILQVALSQAIRNTQHPDGGASVNLEGTQASSGYMVSIYPTRSKAINVDELTISTLYEYIEENVDLLTDTNNFIGLLNDPKTNIIYIDISINVKDSIIATALCFSHDQIAYFDLSTFQSVEVNRLATSELKIETK